MSIKKLISIILIMVVGIVTITAVPAKSQDVTLVNITDTTIHGSSDPSGLTYFPDTETLLQCDSEVDEIPGYTGVNLFELNLPGDLAGIMPEFTKEPTGVAFNTFTGTLFITDDDQNKVFEVNHLTGSVISSFFTDVFGSYDAAGISFDPATGNLFIVDGVSQTIYEVTTSGAVVSSIAVPAEIVDPEGIYFDPLSGNLFLVWNTKLYEITVTGVIVNLLDLLPIGVTTLKGITFAPSSDPGDDPNNFHPYLADYGIDQAFDGRIFEISLNPPHIDSGPTATPNPVFENETSQLSVQASDPDDVTLIYTWIANPGEGTITGSGDTVTYTPPAVTEPRIFTITVTVSDGRGGIASADVEVIVLPVEGGGTEVTIQPIADAYVMSDNPTSNYGLDQDLQVEGSPTKISYMKFDVSGLSGTVQSAVIRLLNLNPSVSGGAISSLSNIDWTENVINFTNRPDIDGLLNLDSIGAVSSGDIVELDVTSSVTGNGIISYAIESNSGDGSSFRSREYVSNPPEMTIITVDPTNTPPQIDSGPTAAPNPVYEHETAQLSVQASDIDLDTLTYSWFVFPGEGTISGTGDTVTYNPPNVTVPQTFTIIVTVTDGRGGRAARAINVSVLTKPYEVTVVNIFDTTAGTGYGSTDPSGLTYFPDNETLFQCDSEVEETPFFADANLFEIGLSANLVAPYDLTGFTIEPTGVALNTVTGTLFITDGNNAMVYEVDPVAPESALTAFSTVDFGGIKPMGISFDPATGNLFIVDRSTHMIYEVTTSGDLVSAVEVPAEIVLPEGIHFDLLSGNFFLVKDARIYEVNTSGVLVTSIDLWNYGTPTLKGITFAPSSAPGDDPNIFHVYLADYGLDEVDDGRILEISLADSTNTPPQIDSGPTATPNPAYDNYTSKLSVQASDADGDTLNYIWTALPGEGTISGSGVTVTYNPPTVAVPQTFTITVLVSDGRGGIAKGTVDVTVRPAGTGTEVTLDVQVASSSDDAEEYASGGTYVTSSDLEMALDSTGLQTVGMRFNGVDIPKEATIVEAYIQFQADEVNTEPTSLTIEGQAHDNAPTFTADNGNISLRDSTTASVSWSPEQWLSVGEQGPGQQTENISLVIQEIMDRPGWVRGNSMVIIITGTGKRVAESYEGSALGAPRLHIKYIVVPPGNQSPNCVAAADPPTIVIPTNSVSLSATVTDDGLPAGSTLTTTWSHVGGIGCGPVTFDNPGVVDTIATFPMVPCIHTLRLTVDDTGLNGFCETTVEVRATPVLTDIFVTPDPATLLVDTTQVFSATGYDQYGAPMPFTPELTATGGTIDPAGVYTAGLTPGVYEVTATDLPTGIFSTATVTVTDAVTTLEVQVTTGSDDAEEFANGNMYLTSSDLELTFNAGGDQTVGMRFNGIGIPQGASIINAYIQFQVDDPATAPTTLEIRGEATDNAPTFTGTTGNISTRFVSLASVPWAPVPWPTTGLAGPDQQTPDLSPVIEEIISRPGWTSGNSMVIIITGTGERVADSYEGSAPGAPLLHIEYAGTP
jgi:hypothetical protein